MENKKYCNIHSFYYTSSFCPFCLKEKSENLYSKYKDLCDKKKKKDNNDRKITETDIQKLINKFNRK